MKRILLLISLLSTASMASQELTQETSTFVRVTPMWSPKLVFSKAPPGTPHLITDSQLGLGIGIEIPILQWLNSGFFTQYIGDVASLSTLPTLPGGLPASLLELSPFIKFQAPIRLGSGHLTPYLMLPLGVSVGMGVPPLFVASLENSEEKPNFLGLGLNGAALVGVEYFPVKLVGIYFEFGYRANIMWHHMRKDNANTWKFEYYAQHGSVAALGVKLSY